jgi:hypothetical protein
LQDLLIELAGVASAARGIDEPWQRML